MPLKFDKYKTRHQLFHISISLATILFCATYVKNLSKWETIGKFSESWIILAVFTGELAKVLLVKYFGRNEKESSSSSYGGLGGSYNSRKQQQKKKSKIPALGDVLSFIFLQVVCTAFNAFICIILGAPVLQNYEQTFVLSLLLTLMAVSPVVWMLGAGGALQVVFCEKADFLTKYEETALELFQYNALGAIIGGWSGSIVAPLDWDREWQSYPIPNVVGCLIGSAFVNLYLCSKILLSTGKLYLNKKRSIK